MWKKSILSRCFFLKNKCWERFRAISTLHYHTHHFWNFGILLPLFFAKIPSNQRFTKELYYKLLWRKKIAWQQWISRFSKLCDTHNQSGNYGTLLSLYFGKNIVKPMYLLKKLLNSWFDEIFFLWDFSTMWHCAITVSHCGFYEIFVSLFQKFPWKQFL